MCVGRGGEFKISPDSVVKIIHQGGAMADFVRERSNVVFLY